MRGRAGQPSGAAGQAPLRILAVADTDSYVKWAAALLGSAPGAWDVRLRVLETPLAVSASQQRS